MNFDNDFNNTSLSLQERKAYRKTFSRISIALFVLIISIQVAAALISILLTAFNFPFFNAPWFLLTFNALCIYGIGTPLFYLVIKKLPPLRMQKIKMRGFEVFALFAVCMTASQAGSRIANAITMLIQSITGNSVQNTLSETLDSTPWYYILLFVGIIGPIFEELIFRKILIPRLMPFGELTAILFSSVAFALFHGNFYQLFYAFGIGFVLGYIFVKTGKLIYPVILHIVFNIIGSVIPMLIVSLLSENGYKMIYEASEVLDFSVLQTSDLIALGSLGLYSIVTMGLALFGLIYIIINLKKFYFAKGELRIPKENTGEVIFFNAGTILLIIVCTIELGLNTFL